jgi:hypothetical protein
MRFDAVQFVGYECDPLWIFNNYSMLRGTADLPFLRKKLVAEVEPTKLEVGFWQSKGTCHVLYASPSLKSPIDLM